MATATENVGMDKTVVVGAALGGIKGIGSVLGSTPAGGKYITEVIGVMTITVSQDLVEEIKGTRQETISFTKKVTVSGNYMTTVTKGDYDVASVEGYLALQAPKNTLGASGQKVLVKAKDQLTLKCGDGEDDAQIVMVPGKIQIKFGSDEFITLEKGKEIYVKSKVINLLSTDGHIGISAETGLRLDGEDFRLTSGSGGLVQAGTTLDIKGDTVVKINCS
jgi:hypothetical protein